MMSGATRGNGENWHIDYIETWLDWYEVLRPRSLDTRRSEIRQFDEWARENGVDSIADLDYATLRSFVGSQKKSGFAAKTIEGRFSAVNQMVTEAVNEGKLDTHPLPREWELEDWDLDSSKTQREKFLEEAGLEEGVTEEEYKQVRENVKSPKNRNQLIVDLLWTTGSRASEIAEIELSDVDFDKRVVEVPDRKKEDPGATREPKYGKICEQAMAAWLTDRGRYECLKDADVEWLFCSRKRAPLYPSRVTDAVRDAAENAGIQQVIGQDAAGRDIYYINAHSLRHGHGTWAADRVGIHRVQRQLGHASVELTESKYVGKGEEEDNPYNDVL